MAKCPSVPALGPLRPRLAGVLLLPPSSSEFISFLLPEGPGAGLRLGVEPRLGTASVATRRRLFPSTRLSAENVTGTCGYE